MAKLINLLELSEAIKLRQSCKQIYETTNKESVDTSFWKRTLKEKCGGLRFYPLIIFVNFNRSKFVFADQVVNEVTTIVAGKYRRTLFVKMRARYEQNEQRRQREQIRAEMAAEYRQQHSHTNAPTTSLHDPLIVPHHGGGGGGGVYRPRPPYYDPARVIDDNLRGGEFMPARGPLHPEIINRFPLGPGRQPPPDDRPFPPGSGNFGRGGGNDLNPFSGFSSHDFI